MTNNKRRLWSILALLVIVFGIGYLLRFDPYGWQQRPDAREAASEQPATDEIAVKEDSAGDQDAASVATDADNGAETADASAAQSGSTEKAPAGVVPSFSILRVEPDGSTVVAGSADPGTHLEVFSGDNLLATAEVGPSGDFAAVLDVPLPPGDYEIGLRSRDDADVIILSEETATVSVPKEDSRDLMVMVTKPGEPSRLINQPEAAASASGDAAGEARVSSSETSAPGEKPVASADTSMKASGGEKTASIADTPEEGTTAAEKPAEETGTATQGKVAAATIVPADEDKQNTGTAGGTAAGTEPATQKAETSGQPTGAEAKAKTEDMAGDTGSAATAASSLQPTATSGTERSEDKPAMRESRVAAAKTGALKSETTAQGGDTGTSPSEAETMATSGPSTDTADEQGDRATQMASLDAKSVRPAASDDNNVRIDAVEIENDRLFVAGSGTPGGRVIVHADNEVIGESPISATGRFLVEVTKELSVGDHIIRADLYMRDEDTPVLRAAVPFNRPEGDMVAAVAAGQQKSDNASMAGSSDGASRAAMSKTSGATATSKDDEGVVVKKPAASGPVGSGSETDMAAKPEVTGMAAATGEQTQPPTVMQPALQQRDNSVIIRRGDTLWQISRRIYGRGVRYTTIYLANTDQIENPDFIEPGQTFMLPVEPLPNAEELHRKRLRRK